MDSPKGPLHGLPISIKENYNVKGSDGTAGFVKRMNKPATHNAPLVQMMLDLGAVPFCKTNVPQSLFW